LDVRIGGGCLLDSGYQRSSTRPIRSSGDCYEGRRWGGCQRRGGRPRVCSNP